MLARFRFLPGLLAWLALVGPASAETAEYRLDPVHTRVLFRVDHAGLSTAIGTFSGASGSLHFDPGDWRTARLEVSVPLASLELGDAGWRRQVLARNFLDLAGQPQARFVSTRVEPTGADSARVVGQLSLRGVSRELVLDVRMNALKRHPVTRRRTAGFSATASLSRREFGMVAWPNAVGDRVELEIEAEAQRGRARASTPAEESDDAHP